MKIKIKETINFGLIKIKPTLNNIFITLTDINGAVLISKHSGLFNFRGSKKKTPYVASLVIKNLISQIININIKFFIIQIQGYIRSGVTRNIIKELEVLKINNIICIEYINKKSHNGLRAKKKRRL
jgi:small subunit ribosomal protein S11